jgi:hypothetical protein
MRRRLLRAAVLLSAVGVALAPLPEPSAGASGPARGAPPEIELVSQTPVGRAPQPFVMTVRLAGVPGDGSLALAVNQRIRSRSELDQSMDGNGLRCCIFQTVYPISAVPAAADGGRRVVLPLDPAVGGLSLSAEGVYPVELTAQDANGAPLATLVTHLIIPPEAGDDAPNLAVAVVAEVGAPLALRPDGEVDLARPDVDDLAALVAGLLTAADVPATLSIRPETAEALVLSPVPSDAELVDGLRAAAAERTVLAEPYVPLDLDALADAGLMGEVGPQQERGRQVLTDLVGVTPDDAVQLAPPTLGEEGLPVLAFAGTSRVVVDEDQLEPLEPGIIDYSLAQPFVVAMPDDAEADDDTPGAISGMAPDPVVMERLNADDAPGLVVSRVLAELALLRLERPSVARASVLRLEPGLSSATVAQLLAAIDTGRPFDAVTLLGAFEHAAPVLDGGGNPVERPLDPARPDEIDAGTARAINTRRADLDTFTELVGPESPESDLPSRHLLAASAANLRDALRREHLEAAVAGMADVASKVTTPASFTLTLTAREGTIPLTVRNDSGVPVDVVIHLRSQRLEFPDGETIPLRLDEASTRIDIPVRSLATGAFPLLIDVRTPDGRRSLSTSRYTVRSTAVSGVGLLLSVGAGLFLAVWWARHWHRTRRSRKLIGEAAPVPD